MKIFNVSTVNSKGSKEPSTSTTRGQNKQNYNGKTLIKSPDFFKNHFVKAVRWWEAGSLCEKLGLRVEWKEKG